MLFFKLLYTNASKYYFFSFFKNHFKSSLLLSWYLQWFAVPSSSIIKTAMERVKPKLVSASSVPLLRLLLPRTHINAIGEIDKLLVSPQVSG
jgi:anaphase-promoting complex subunit 1